MNPMRRMERRASTPTRYITCTVKCQTMCAFWHHQQLLTSTRRPGMLTPTVGRNEYMKDNFLIKIETWHKPDMGVQENVHGLDPDQWKKTEVVYIDIADKTQVDAKDYKTEEDPAIFKSEKTGRGPLGPNWKKELPSNTNSPHMCAYKLVTVNFKWWGVQNKIENFIQKQEKRLFTKFHRQLFCLIDKWIGLTMADIRRIEEETQKELDEMRVKDPVKGSSASED
ncbi:phosphatidylinositol transfer protein alpha isoform-like isoform 2-T2 [Salvelinus alpinus]